MALLVSRLTMVKAKSSGCVKSSAGASWVTTRHAAGSSGVSSGRCANIAPATLRSSRPAVGPHGSPGGTSTNRTLAFHAGRVLRASTASAVKAGAAITSTNIPGLSRHSAAAASKTRFTATIEPNALVGSADIAASSASSTVAALAAPQGFVCLITAAPEF